MNYRLATEQAITAMDVDSSTVTALRFPAACRPAFVLLVVLKEYVACAFTTKNFSLLSDRPPPRPFIDVKYVLYH